MTVVFDRGRQAAPVPAGPQQPAAPTIPARAWPIRGAMIFGLAVTLAVLAGLILWGAGARISGAVVVPGIVEVQQHRQVVQHPDGGVVARIAVADGASVAAGDLLLSLDGSLLESELAIVEAQYLETLARRGRLEAERADLDRITFPAALLAAGPAGPGPQLAAGQQQLFTARRATLSQSLEQLDTQARQVEDEIAGIDAQIAAARRQAALIGADLADQQSLLDRGLSQRSRVTALGREAAQMDGDLGAMQARRAAARTRLSELEVMKLRLRAEQRERAEAELRELGPRELELAEHRRALRERASRLAIRAPVAGIVHNMQVTTPRGVIRPAEPLLWLVPQDRPLLVAVRVPPMMVDVLTPGQQVALRVAAVSARHTPEISGRLERVAPDVLVDEMTRSPYFRAEVSIPPAEVDRLAPLALLPGMAVEAYIRTGERTPLDYLTKPLTDYFARAFRED
ncbi:HlyD family type I secretion periplasmic adaptor subunit [Paracoccus tibetensis]|uniref:Membrane fusion protein (MFP) family protein n=1 Tax=Paracoccus tibetensis TaxID=336292 RepID=A0A1G5GCU8_9RHOB|nr:HlyD family type I secretion periplasmic adaptor subunit [Paracoccus tibetensis]SCY49119.1 HlyD family secretion protein [Paracoccus tibetensis]